MATRDEPPGGTVEPQGSSDVPSDPQPPSPIFAVSNLYVRSFSLVLFIVALLLCLLGMELGFVAFMILGLVFEIIDLTCGVSNLRQMWGEVDRCVSGWKSLEARRQAAKSRPPVG